MEKLKWLWPNVFPLGKIALIVGDPDRGKSILSLHVAAQVTTGRPWINSMTKREPSDVLILTTEDDLADTVGPRLVAAGANMERVHYINCVVAPDGKKSNLYNLTKDFNVLIKAVMKIGPNLKLIIIDPISGFMEGKNENKNAEVREYLNPLAELARSCDLSIIGISHMNKNQLTQSASYRVLGSIAFTAAVRAVWLVHQDPEDEVRRLFVPLKGNLSKTKTGLAYTIMTAQVQTEQGPAGHAYCAFSPEEITIKADELLAPKPLSKKTPKRDEVADWLKDYLSKGPVKAKEIYNVGSQMGFSEKSIKYTKSKLGIQDVKTYNPETGTHYWEWSLLT